MKSVWDRLPETDAQAVDALLNSFEQHHVDTSQLPRVALLKHGNVVGRSIPLETERKTTLIDRAQAFLGRLIVSSYRQELKNSEQFDDEDEERAWDSVWGH